MGASEPHACAGQPAGACDDSRITIPAGQTFALCCSGGGIRSATFNLGVVQALQAAKDVFGAVTTVTAVSGGSYLAAAHALVTANPGTGAAPAALGDQAPYALRSPEEIHLRDHTRYLLESWQIAVRALAVLIFGVLVNAVLVGSLIFIAAHLSGWLLSSRLTGILTGLQTGSPQVQARWWWLIPGAAAVATIGLAWWQARTPEQPPGQPGARRRARSAVRNWLNKDGRMAWVRRSLRPLVREQPPRLSNRALAFTTGTAFLLVAAPYAIKGLYTVSLGSDSLSVITRFLGFSSGTGCKAAAQAAVAASHASHQVCGAVATAPNAAKSNGGGAGSLRVLLTTFGGAAAAIVALARTTIGRLRTFQADLSKSGPFAGATAKVGSFLRRRLVPWIGSGLIVGFILMLTLRWIGTGASHSPLAEGWGSVLARCGYALLVFVLVKLGIDINATSVHAFYRDRLATAYGVVRQPGPGGAEVLDASWAQLSTLRGAGGRTLVVCAAANCTTGGDIPPGRGSVSFTFTPADIGLSRKPVALPAAGEDPAATVDEDRAETADYQTAAGITLFDAVAVSGAAVSPVMGKMTRPAMRILLSAANARLGVWLPSPARVRDEISWAKKHPPRHDAGRRGLLRRIGSAMRRHWWQPDLKHLWAEAAGTLHLDGRWMYVTDGGHYENLGMVEALRRKPHHLIVVDASGDGPAQFSTLGQAIALARSELGVHVDIKPAASLRADPQTGLCGAPYATGTFSYPGENDETASPHHLVYLKLAVPVDAPLDVLAYKESHDTFPTDSTLQQLYDDQEFEAYRELGYHCARAAVRDISYGGDGAPPGSTTVPGARRAEPATVGATGG
jgi:hypothetical protein